MAVRGVGWAGGQLFAHQDHPHCQCVRPLRHRIWDGIFHAQGAPERKSRSNGRDHEKCRVGRLDIHNAGRDHSAPDRPVARFQAIDSARFSVVCFSCFPVRFDWALLDTGRRHSNQDLPHSGRWRWPAGVRNADEGLDRLGDSGVLDGADSVLSNGYESWNRHLDRRRSRAESILELDFEGNVIQLHFGNPLANQQFLPPGVVPDWFEEWRQVNPGHLMAVLLQP